MTRLLRIGTRGSALALVQARWVSARLAEHHVPTEIVIIRTEGDDRPVDTAWGEGAFVGAIVGGLLDGSVDLAVHSAKDVPTDEHPRLVIAAYPPREDPRDALVGRVRGTTLATLPLGSRVGTDSPRRTAFLLAIRPDLRLHPLHGNVDTRLAKLDRGDSDALVLAVAGLTRLGRADRIDDILPADLVASAPGQGSLAIQVRADDDEAIEAVGRLDDPDTRVAVEAERALLNATGGGCRSPIGAIGKAVAGGNLILTAGAERSWTPVDGAPIRVSPVVWVHGTAPAAAHRDLAERLAARIVALRLRPRVLVCRPDAQSAELVGAFDAEGVEAANVPAIEIVPAAPGGELDAAFAALVPGDWILVASVNAARAAVAAAGLTGVDPAAHRWAAIGTATVAALASGGIATSFVPAAATADSMARTVPIVPGDRVLLPRADIADPEPVATLRARGAVVLDVVAYRTLEAPEASRSRLAAALDDGPVDALVLTSGSIARGLLALGVGTDCAGLLATPVIAIGATTAAVARGLGFGTVLVAPSPEPGALAAFVAASLGRAPHVGVPTVPALHDGRVAAPIAPGGSR